MPFYRFEGDDIAIGRDFAIVAHGQRRLLLEPLSAGDIAWLRAARDGAPVDAQAGDPKLVELLRQQRLLADAASGRGVKVTARIPARVVARLAAPLRPLTAAVPLALILAASLLVLGEAASRAARQTQSVGVPLSGWPVIIGLWLVSALLHELGHAAACLRFTGAVGAIRVIRGRRLLGLVTDVSSLCRATPSERGLIAVSGMVLQTGFAAAVAMAEPLGLLPPGIATAAAALIALTAASCAVPARRSDGDWALRDLFGLELEPRLTRRPGGRLSGLGWGYAVLAMRLALLGVASMTVLRALIHT
jgi:putative peptide zinc metalloprotease protein